MIYGAGGEIGGAVAIQSVAEAGALDETIACMTVTAVNLTMGALDD